MSDPSYPVFPVFAFLGFFLVLVPLPWHFQAWNAGTCLYMIWAAIACLNQFVNSVVWHNNALNPAPVWCDISVRIIIGSSVAIPAASLCINRRLYKIATMQTASVTREQKRRAVIEDLAVGLGIPILEMGLQFIVAGHRFNIFEEIGCYPATYNVWLTYLLVAAWPIGLGLVSAGYCFLTLRNLSRRRKQFNEVLKTTSMTVNRYFRLMALATTELLCTTPFAAYSIYLNLTTEPVQPYKGWADTHFDYGRVEQIPSTLWRLDHKTVVSLELSRWLVVACALVFFMFFGFADEARRNYVATFWAVMSKLRIVRRMPPLRGQFLYTMPSARKPSPKSFTGSSGTLPLFIDRKPTNETRFSLASTLAPIDEKKHVPQTPSAATISDLESNTSKSEYDESYGHAY